MSYNFNFHELLFEEEGCIVSLSEVSGYSWYKE